MANREVQLTLEEAVAEVIQSMTGLDLEYDPGLERFRSITRALNRALRFVAYEHEWSYYSSIETVGTAAEGQRIVDIPSKFRPRQTSDDAVRLVDSEGHTWKWAYFLPRDALSKYENRRGLWVSAARSQLMFSRPLWSGEAGMSIVSPVMREPTMFRLPKESTAPSRQVLNQPVDFDYPDLVIAKAVQMMAESDPVMQPRVQTLEAKYKDIMYQLIERDDRFTDSPYLNDFVVPMDGSLYGGHAMSLHGHPHGDERSF